MEKCMKIFLINKKRLFYWQNRALRINYKLRRELHDSTPKKIRKDNVPQNGIVMLVARLKQQRKISKWLFQKSTYLQQKRSRRWFF